MVSPLTLSPHTCPGTGSTACSRAIAPHSLSSHLSPLPTPHTHLHYDWYAAPQDCMRQATTRPSSPLPLFSPLSPPTQHTHLHHDRYASPQDCMRQVITPHCLFLTLSPTPLIHPPATLARPHTCTMTGMHPASTACGNRLPQPSPYGQKQKVLLRYAPRLPPYCTRGWLRSSTCWWYAWRAPPLYDGCSRRRLPPKNSSVGLRGGGGRWPQHAVPSA